MKNRLQEKDKMKKKKQMLFLSGLCIFGSSLALTVLLIFVYLGLIKVPNPIEVVPIVLLIMLLQGIGIFRWFDSFSQYKRDKK